MLAVFLAWLMLATILKMITTLSGWECGLLAAIPFAIWYIKRPEDF